MAAFGVGYLIGAALMSPDAGLLLGLTRFSSAAALSQQTPH
jgi:hypothetical protein